MKKIILISVFCFIVFVVLGLFIIRKSLFMEPKFKYSQEYEIGKRNIKGEVDIYYFTSKSKDFDIGANKYGYAVFKNPNKAFSRLKKEYKKGIKLIQKEYKFMPLSNLNYKKYKNYGWQVKHGSVDEKEQTKFISTFMDIYENSYELN